MAWSTTEDGRQEDLTNGWLHQKIVKLDAKSLGRLAIERNAKTIAQRAQLGSVSHLVESERALYDPTLTLSASRSVNRTARSSAEVSADVQRLISCGLDPECEGSIDDLQLDNRQISSLGGYGIQVLTPTGAQLEFKHGVQGSQNNMTDPRYVMEATGSLMLTVTQPLLKGYGRDITEADLQVAEREYDIEFQNLRRQMLDTLGESVGAYWQLYQSERSVFWRQDAVKMAQSALAEVKSRQQMGYGNPLEISDAELAVNAREIDLIRAKQRLAEVQARIRNALNLPGDQFAHITFQTSQDTPPVSDIVDSLEKDAALNFWPSFKIAQLRQEQENIRLRYAKNQTLPDLSVALSYSKNLMSATRMQALKKVGGSRYKGWSVGVTLSTPLAANSRADGKFAAQETKVWAANEAVQAERGSWANELVARQEQLEATKREMLARRQAVELRQEALRLQQGQFEAGRSRVRAVLERQDQLNESRLQAVEATVSWKLAELQLIAVSGDVLAHHGVALTHQ